MRAGINPAHEFVSRPLSRGCTERATSDTSPQHLKFSIEPANPEQIGANNGQIVGDSLPAAWRDLQGKPKQRAVADKALEIARYATRKSAVVLTVSFTESE